MPPKPPVPCRVVIVDDHIAITEMLSSVVQLMPSYRVVGVAFTADTAVELCERERPDVVVLDLVMPQRSGQWLATEIKQVSPLSRILVFSGNLTPVAIRGVLSVGVDGIVDKSSSISVFCEGIVSVAAGQIYFTSYVSGLIKNVVRSAKAPEAVLTPRERVVLQHLAEGRSAREIAEMLGISESTVVNHRGNLMRKAGLRRTAQLSFYAARMGLIGEVAPPVES